jgi:hypothetical protein
MVGKPVRLAQGQPVPMPMPPGPTQSSGMPPVPAGTGSTSEHDSMMQCVAGGIALLALIILPLVLE